MSVETENARAVFLAIESWADEGEEAPSTEMLAERAGLAVSTVHHIMKRFIDEMIVIAVPRVNRDGVELTSRPILRIVGVLPSPAQKGLFG